MSFLGLGYGRKRNKFHVIISVINFASRSVFDRFGSFPPQLPPQQHSTRRKGTMFPLSLPARFLLLVGHFVMLVSLLFETVGFGRGCPAACRPRMLSWICHTTQRSRARTCLGPLHTPAELDDTKHRCACLGKRGAWFALMSEADRNDTPQTPNLPAPAQPRCGAWICDCVLHPGDGWLLFRCLDVQRQRNRPV